MDIGGCCEAWDSDDMSRRSPSKSDLLMFPDVSRKTHFVMKSMGKDVDIFELDGDGGHSESRHIEKAGTKLREFLN
jgi:hypothetical protein